jgi:hypothetical protein
MSGTRIKPHVLVVEVPELHFAILQQNCVEHDSIAMTGMIRNTITPYPGFCSTTEDLK